MEPFIGEIKICAFQFAPRGWAFCDGSMLAINQNQALYSLLGAQFGSSTSSSFALPDLRGRVAVHQSPSYPMGAMAGEETVTLTNDTIPTHSHQFVVSTTPANQLNVGIDQENILATSNLYSPTNPAIQGPGKNLYTAASNLTPLQASICSNTGSGAAHENMQPSLVINYIIALSGIYPTRD
ncbi:phage tail protein [Solimicrobium silvestre]|uniref:Microcystin-dependent protein n=1 Tax=Solimicrobium silvestre TaxID=2099400 RepID=A0A2S9H4U1_9BURK|nr:tail fiber protein [Solimicrobium silvestre]PRC95005.1 Microcystin-dependent protein [Solimicrobium silvestre]